MPVRSQPHTAKPATKSDSPATLRRAQCFFGIHQDLHPHAHDTALYAGVTEAMVETVLTRIRPDFVQFDCKGHPGYTGYPTRVGSTCPGIACDALAIWRKVTRRHGVGLYVHYSGVMDSAACRAHPDWARVDENGKPDPDRISVFSTYVHDLLIPQLKEAIDRYDLDGVWVDGDCWALKPDYCRASIEAFRRATGVQDPPRRPQDPHWREFLDIQREQFLRYLRAYVDELHAHRRTFQVASNWAFTSCQPQPIEVNVDYLSGDILSSIDQPRFEARYLSSTDRPWDLMLWAFTKPGGMGDPRTMWSYKPATQLQREAAVVLAQGGAYQFLFDGHAHRSAHLDDDVVELAAQVARFCRKRQACCHRTRTVPQVALLLSKQDLYERISVPFATPAAQCPGLTGTLYGLLDQHYSVDVLAEHQLESRMSEYPLIVLPETTALKQTFLGQIEQYVRAGGRLLLVGVDTARLFEPLLGVELGGPALDAADYAQDVQYFLHALQPPDHVQGGAYLSADRMMAWTPGPWAQVRPTTAKPIAQRFPTIDRDAPSAVAATLAPHGRGQVAAIFGPLGLAIMASHHPTLCRVLGQVVAELFPHPLATLDESAPVELVLRRQDDRLLIHLINMADVPRAGEFLYIDYIPPLGLLTLRVRCNTKPRQVSLEPEAQTPPWHWRDGLLTVQLPQLDIHATVIVREAI